MSKIERERERETHTQIFFQEDKILQKKCDLRYFLLICKKNIVYNL
jgi:hypothetical protein